ncbi:hypothetical protein ABZ642_21290 [Streptomyces sp. NPDC007157]|uniref:hypothetical protein n=1 Tax=Streptomyces sp. NPDC007157 TaxID=3154681 RepID=UPI0033D8646E
MNRWIRRVSVAVASTALAGGALLGAGGSASAATTSGPAEHARTSAAAFVAGSDRDSHREDGYRSGHHGDQHFYRMQEERGDGSRLYAWDGHRWQEEVTARSGIGGDRWYLDQVAWYLHQR